MKRHSILSAITVVAVLWLVFALFVPKALAQAPTPDSYEPNETLAQASLIPVGSELGNLSISPAGDQDWFRVLINPPTTYAGTYRVEVIGTPGLDLTLNLYDPNAILIQANNNPGSSNAAATFSASSEGYYAVQVFGNPSAEGWYLLRVVNLTPGPTPTPTRTPTSVPTGTLIPTATSPFPTNTPTPNLGGEPDYAEPNYDFATAYRIAPGQELKGLNFNSGMPGAIDNDFFVMAVRVSVTYTCRTFDLGPGLDTNMILYNSPSPGIPVPGVPGASQNDVIGGNDDVDTQAGQINSQVTFTSTKEGDITVLVGYKYTDPNIRQPGSATYSLTCVAAAPPATPAPSTGGGSGGGYPPAVTPISIWLISQPETGPTPTLAPVVPQTVDVLVGYDRNQNGQIDPSEGVAGLSVRVIDAAANRELSHGFTDASGTVRFTLVTSGAIRAVIPFLGAAKDFRPGSPAQWTILIPAASAPGLIP